MGLFREFSIIIGALNKRDLQYTVVGGIALAFHHEPRFTRNIDILAKPADLPVYEGVFSSLGYFKTGEPWTFLKTNITLHRFAKHSVEDEDELLIIDLLIGHEARHEAVILNSLTDDSRAGSVRVATKDDLIWMKKIRASKQDEADIENLEGRHEQD